MASLLAMAYQASHISDSAMRIIIAVIGLAVLVDVLLYSREADQRHAAASRRGQRGRNSRRRRRARRGQAARQMEACLRRSGEGRRTFRPRNRGVPKPCPRPHRSKKIAEREVVSIYTVRAHTRSIYAKLDVHSKKELTALVQKHVDEG